MRTITVDHINGVKNLLSGIKELVDHPDDVSVIVIPGAYEAIVQLETNVSDVPIIVGKSGHVISSLRSLVAVFSGKHRIKLSLNYKTDADIQNKRNEERGYRSRGGNR